MYVEFHTGEDMATGMYCEACVKKQNSFGKKVLEMLWVVFSIYLVVFAVFIIQSVSLLLIAIIDVILLILFLPSMMFQEYEIIFCDGQIDVDVIRRGRKRKHLKRYDLSNADIVAHISDKKLKEYVIDWKKDFSSGIKSDNVYAMILRNNDRHGMVVFEPSDRMLECIKNKLPRKTFILEKKSQDEE